MLHQYQNIDPRMNVLSVLFSTGMLQKQFMVTLISCIRGVNK